MGEMIPDGYRILVHYDPERSHFVARVPELGDVKAEAASRGEALTKAEEAIDEAIRRAAGEERELPQPLDRAEFSGELTVSLSPSLHRELAFLALEDGLEPEQLAAELINTGVAIKSTGKLRSGAGGRGADADAKGGNRRRGGGRKSNKKSYHNILDDRAAFIEYVRNIDGGGGGGGAGGGGKRGGRGRGGRRRK